MHTFTRHPQKAAKRSKGPSNSVYVFVVLLLAIGLYAAYLFNVTATSRLLRPTGSARKYEAKYKISVLSVIYHEEDFLEGYLVDVTNQTAFNQSQVLLGVVGTLSDPANQLLANYTARFKNILAVRFTNESIMVPEVWNILLKDYVQGLYVTTFNIVDRRHPDSLAICAHFLDTYAHYDLLAVGVRATEEKNKNWFQITKYHDWWSDKQGYEFGLINMFNYDSHAIITGNNNIPHNGPMWRHAIHDHLGYFDLADAPVSDFAFWLKMLRHGSRAWLLNKVINMYYIPGYGPHLDWTSNQVKVQAQTAIASFKAHTMCRPLNIFVAYDRPPSAMEGGDMRVRGMLRFLKNQGHNVYAAFVKQRAADEETRRYLRSLGSQVFLMDSELDSLRMLQSNGTRIDIGIFSNRFNSNAMTVSEIGIPKLKEYHSSAKVVVLSDEIHHLRLQQISLASCDATCVSKIELKEKNTAAAANMILTLSQQDQETIGHWSGRTPVEVLPYSDDFSAVKVSKKSYESRSGLLFVGSGNAGNQVAVELLVRKVLPLLQAQDPDITVTVVGSPKWGKLYNTTPGVVTLERADLAPLFDSHRVFVHPALIKRSGASVKNLLPVMYGVPVVTTHAGVQGMCCDTDPDVGCTHFTEAVDDGAVADNGATAFANTVWSLYSSKAEWEAARARVMVGRKCMANESMRVGKESLFMGMMRRASAHDCDMHSPKPF